MAFAFFYKQCPSRWTMLQIIASCKDSKNSYFPVAVRVKNDVSSGGPSTKFYYLDWRDNFIIDKHEEEHLKRFLYDGFVVREFRFVLELCIVDTFKLFEWKDVELKDEVLTLPTCKKPVAYLVDNVVQLVRKNVKSCIVTLSEGFDPDARPIHIINFESLWRKLGVGYIAELCVELTHAFRVNKNWNSHGARVGAAVCELGSLMAMMATKWITPAQNFTQAFVDDFRQNMPQGKMLTGQMYGGEDNVYMEYLVVPYTDQPLLSYSRLFQTAKTTQPAADRAADLADSLKIGSNLQARPTKSHTLDFMCSYKGIHIIDGECKDTSTRADEELLLTSALAQFAFRDSAIALMTTSTSFQFYKLVKDANCHTLIHPTGTPAQLRHLQLVVSMADNTQ